MYEREIIKLLNQQSVFVATVSGIAPQVRPMQVSLSSDGLIYLACPAYCRAAEIAVNDQATVCTADNSGSLLWLSGRLEPIITDLEAIATSAGEFILYWLRVHSLQFRPVSGDLYTRIEGPLDLSGIRL